MKAWKYFTSWFQDNEGCVEVVQYNVFLTWKTFGSRAEIGWSDCDFILLLGEEPPPGLLLPPALVVKVLHYPLTWRTLILSAVLAGNQALFVWSRLRLKRGYRMTRRDTLLLFPFRRVNNRQSRSALSVASFVFSRDLLLHRSSPVLTDVSTAVNLSIVYSDDGEETFVEKIWMGMLLNWFVPSRYFVIALGFWGDACSDN